MRVAFGHLEKSWNVVSILKRKLYVRGPWRNYKIKQKYSR